MKITRIKPTILKESTNPEINIELRPDDVKNIMCKARDRVDRSAYKPGSRREKIWGWFWKYLEKRLGRELTLDEFYAYSNIPGVKELIFNR